jgi:hypothetical protein
MYKHPNFTDPASAGFLFVLASVVKVWYSDKL